MVMTATITLPVAVVPMLPATASLFFVVVVSLLCLLGAAAKLRPGAVKTLVLAIWRQKPGLLVIVGTVVLVQQGRAIFATTAPAERSVSNSVPSSWPMFRGSL